MHRLILYKKLGFVSKKPLKILTQLNATPDFSTSASTTNSFKDINSDQINVSLFNIKKSLKLANTDFEDGFTHLKTHCPACDSPSGKAEDIYINKTTGKVIFAYHFVQVLIALISRPICVSKMPIRSKVWLN